ncbi:hypothetical protein M0812_06149 [Anaeramoeba flamelloides]|uniref:Uncharacterized protein n=1 Tax=Anaeramoeba flamelloides TaxID=1746091 RepID=A0AAV8AB95_9EUKA|nr:hypothetical protein M0812_06149 [Anaeramoeba flamelloides]
MMYSIANQPKDTFRRRITRSTKQMNCRNSDTNCNTIGIFQYCDVTLQDILEKAPEHMVYNSCFQFYIPIDVISYSNEKVINRCIWAANNNRYSSNTDLVPLIIHSSIYVPPNEKKKKKKINCHGNPVGLIVSFQFIPDLSPKYLMKRKNGIRSRYCSKSSDKVVMIRDVNYLQSQSQVPTNFFEIEDLPNYVSSVTPPKEESQKNHMIETAMLDNFNPNLAIDFTLLNGNSAINRKRKSQLISVCKKKSKKIILRKRVKSNKKRKKINKQTKVKTTTKKTETVTKKELQVQKENKNVFQQNHSPEANNEQEIKIVNTNENVSFFKEQFPNNCKNNTGLSVDILNLHYETSVSTSVETTYFSSVNHDLWDTFQVPTLYSDDSVLSPLEQYQFGFNNDFSSLKNDLVFEEILPYSYGYDSAFIY